MRNLKRVLSLALALVMILGMMVMGAGAASADFSDGAEIDYVEAVDVISGLGVMIGSDDNGDGVYEFEADDYLTRAETAKIMCYILMGGTNAEKLPKNEAVFKDVAAGSWAAGFISYCNNLEIMVGDGKGNFDPTGNLTGVQFAKMLLVAAGYDPNAEGYAYDKNWAANIGKDAIANGIDLKGVALADPVTREQAAQMIFNALDVYTVDYVTIYDYETGTDKVVGPIGSNVTFMGQYFKTLTKDPTGGSDDWGRPYSYQWKNGNKVLYTSWATPVYTSTVAVDGCTLLKALGYPETSTTTVTFNTYTNSKTAAVTPVTSVHGNPCSAKNQTFGAQGRLMEVYKETASNTYRVVYIDTYLAKIGDTTKAANTHTNTDSVALTVYQADSTGAAYNYTYAAGTKAYTKNAYALVNIADGVVKTVTEIAPAATAKGAYWLNTAAGETTIVGGVTYNDACKFYVGQNTWDATKTWNVYTDAYGNIIGLVEYVAPNTYVYGVISAMKWVDTNDLLNSGYVLSNIVKMDATTMANTILAANALVDSDTNTAGTQPSKFSSSGAAAGDYETATVSESTQYNGEYADTLFQYTLNANGSYNITAKASVVSGTEDIKAGVADLFIGTDSNIMATNDNTVYLVKTGAASYATYVGYKNVPSMNGVSVQFLKAATASGVYTDYVFVDATSATYDGAAGYVWFTKDLTTADAIGYNAAGDKAYVAYVDGVPTVVYLDKDTEAATLTSINGWDLYAVTRNADGDITSATRWTNTAIAGVTGITGTVITNGTVAYNVTGATVYAYAADGSSVSVVPEANWSSVVVNATTPKTAYCKDLNNDNIIDIIYVVADPT